jgi:cellulose synthase/poly-beta-1,6-N-acetylglucosamine synthase-like glycosyltransferase
MMTLVQNLLTGLYYLTGAYLLFNCAYILFFALAGHTKSARPVSQAPGFRRFCILIPAYKEDAVILETAQSAMAHKYRGLFDVFVVADGLKPETVLAIKKTGARVIEVYFEKSTKGKALQTAMAAIPANVYASALVLDADNIMGQGFLEMLNNAFAEGFQVIQGHRTAKNTQTPFAFLDACNEEINNQIFRKGHQALGLSAALIGSGMAFDFLYLKKLLEDIGEVAGEDKELDFRIVRDRVHVHYLHQAYIFDEKVSHAKVFSGQRSRWISAQITSCRKHFLPSLEALFKHHNFSFFNKGLQTLLLPRILLLGALTLLLGLSCFSPNLADTIFYACLLLAAGLALLIALPRHLYRKSLLQALLRLPAALFFMVLALCNIGKVKKSFIHTPHGSPSPAMLLTFEQPENIN